MIGKELKSMIACVLYTSPVRGQIRQLNPGKIVSCLLLLPQILAQFLIPVIGVNKYLLKNQISEKCFKTERQNTLLLLLFLNAAKECHQAYQCVIYGIHLFPLFAGWYFCIYPFFCDSVYSLNTANKHSLPPFHNNLPLVKIF